MSEPIYRPGLEGIVAAETAISTISGGLQYRGYSIEDLARFACFEEAAHLVLHGELPTADELAAFRRGLASGAQLPGPLVELLEAIPSQASLMDVLRTAASALAHWDVDSADNTHDANLRKAVRLISQLPVVLGSRFRITGGHQPLVWDDRLSFAENTLWLLSGSPPSAQAAKAMDVSLVLYMEHELNASTFAARVVCSTLSDLHSSITAAIGALKGPLHGGANERVMETLDRISAATDAESWVRDALARKERIMGFGHRVYKQGDPRAVYLKGLCGQLADETGHEDLETMAEQIERIVYEEKGLRPNLDWPSARLYHYLGLPIDLYTPLFVISRVVGWSAHVIEQLDNNRLIRPRARYTGPAPREWRPIERRGGAGQVEAGQG